MADFFQKNDQMQKKLFATWSNQSGLRINSLSKYERRKDLLGKTLITTVVSWEPYMLGKQTLFAIKFPFISLLAILFFTFYKKKCIQS